MAIQIYHVHGQTSGYVMARDLEVRSRGLGHESTYRVMSRALVISSSYIKRSCPKDLDIVLTYKAMSRHHIMVCGYI